MGPRRPLHRALTTLDQAQQRWRPTAFVVAVIKKYGDDAGGQLAAAIAYYGLLSLFPLLLLLAAVLGYLLAGSQDLQRSLLDSALAQFPVIGPELRGDVGALRGNGFALVAGALGALWSAMAALAAAQRAMDRVWDIPPTQRTSFVGRRARSLLMVGVLGLGVVATTVLGALSAFTSDLLGALTRPLAIAASVTASTGLFVLAYRILTGRRLRVSEFLPGSIGAGIAWTILHLLGGLYVDRVVTGASDVYGTFALVIGVMSWIYAQAVILVMFAEVNVVRAERLWPRELFAPRPRRDRSTS